MMSPTGAAGGPGSQSQPQPQPPSNHRNSKLMSTPVVRRSSDIVGAPTSNPGSFGFVGGGAKRVSIDDIDARSSLLDDKYKIEEEDVYKELVSTYVDREGRMLNSIDQLTMDNDELRVHLRRLINNYIECVRFLSDGLLGNSTVAPNSSNPAFDQSNVDKWSRFFELQEKKLNDQMLIGKEAIDKTEDRIKKSELLQRDVSTSQIRSIQSDFVAENEKYVVIIKSYKNSLKQVCKYMYVCILIYARALPCSIYSSLLFIHNSFID